MSSKSYRYFILFDHAFHSFFTLPYRTVIPAQTGYASNDPHNFYYDYTVGFILPLVLSIIVCQCRGEAREDTVDLTALTKDKLVQLRQIALKSAHQVVMAKAVQAHLIFLLGEEA